MISERGNSQERNRRGYSDLTCCVVAGEGKVSKKSARGQTQNLHSPSREMICFQRKEKEIRKKNRPRLLKKGGGGELLGGKSSDRKRNSLSPSWETIARKIA